MVVFTNIWKQVFKKLAPPLPLTEVRRALADKSLREVSDYWKTTQAHVPSTGRILGVVERLYELALKEENIPMKERKHAYRWAENLTGLLEKSLLEQGNTVTLDAVRSQITFMKNAWNINRPLS